MFPCPWVCGCALEGDVVLAVCSFPLGVKGPDGNVADEVIVLITCPVLSLVSPLVQRVVFKSASLGAGGS